MVGVLQAQPQLRLALLLVRRRVCVPPLPCGHVVAYPPRRDFLHRDLQTSSPTHIFQLRALAVVRMAGAEAVALVGQMDLRPRRVNHR